MQQRNDSNTERESLNTFPTHGFVFKSKNILLQIFILNKFSKIIQNKNTIGNFSNNYVFFYIGFLNYKYC